MPQPVLDAIQDYLVLESRYGGYEAADMKVDKIRDAYQSVARLLHTTADNVAFVENATVGWAQAISCIPFHRGDRILTSANDYISNQITLLSLAANRAGNPGIDADSFPAAATMSDPNERA